MFSLSNLAKAAAEKTVAAMAESGDVQKNVEGFAEMFISTVKEQPKGIAFLDQIEAGGKTYYVCQKIV